MALYDGSYDYQKSKEEVFSEDGQEMFLKIRDEVQKLLTISGAFRLGNAISARGITGDSFTMLACIDRLEEIGEIREIPYLCATQHKIYIKGIVGVNAKKSSVRTPDYRSD
jgi:hypothetical protein